ncbi:MAG: hypothetical protein ACXAEL_07785 [Candidatus Hodarchaeales archaeon]|jgi:hypothetical protein
MPSGKFIAGLVLIGLAVPFIGIPIFTTPPLLTRESDSIEYRTESSNFNEERGYELSVGRGFTSLLIKLDIVMWNIPDNVDLVSLVAYDSEDSGATEYLLGEASPEDDEVSFTFRELGLAATSLGLSNPIYYLQAADGNHDDLDTANFKFAVTTLLPVLIGPIMAIVGLVLLFLGRGGGYSRIRRDPGRVAFGDAVAEPVMGSSRPTRSPKKRKKKKRRKGERPAARPVGGPKAKASKCPSCGANVPAGQMYCPSCYARV